MTTNKNQRERLIAIYAAEALNRSQATCQAHSAAASKSKHLKAEAWVNSSTPPGEIRDLHDPYDTGVFEWGDSYRYLVRTYEEELTKVDVPDKHRLPQGTLHLDHELATLLRIVSPDITESEPIDPKTLNTEFGRKELLHHEVASCYTVSLLVDADTVASISHRDGRDRDGRDRDGRDRDGRDGRWRDGPDGRETSDWAHLLDNQIEKHIRDSMDSMGRRGFKSLFDSSSVDYGMRVTILEGMLKEVLDGATRRYEAYQEKKETNKNVSRGVGDSNDGQGSESVLADELLEGKDALALELEMMARSI